ncbi:MAG: c-type cytochrome [Isosphaeraceae bacterium]|nr:c-type cytochrome [Isosphaeraceae bacterium]
MTLSIVWMILADHLRPWKSTQREFHFIEDAKLRASEAKKQAEINQTKQKEIEDKIALANQQAEENSKQIREQQNELKRIVGQFEAIDTATRFQKAELDSQRSLYDGMIDRGENARARRYIDDVIVPNEKKYQDLRLQLEEIKSKRASAEANLASLRGNVSVYQKQLDSLTLDRDRVSRALAQKEAQYFGPLAWFRNLPLIDAAAPATKIQQISLPELTINYNFKDVPRYDRCTTCHAGIDRPGYHVDANDLPMPQPFSSHPHLTDGAVAINPKGERVVAGLYLDGNGPHGINKFGCTICHGGQGSGTDFTYSSHTPNTLEERERWHHERGWHEMHHWDEPMLPRRFLESSCIKCHHQVTDVPQATKLQAGYEKIVKYGCTGCHTIGGEGSFGPDMTDERPVGPNLRHIASKTTKDWTAKWVRNPHNFRPDTRMPRFYDVTNNLGRADQPKNNAEVRAMTHYLFAVSTPPEGFVEPQPAGKNDPALPPPASETSVEKGKQLFLQKGCLACHAHKETAPDAFPEAVRDYAKADYGPNLSEITDKFPEGEAGYKWLVNWIKQPEKYHDRTLMPNLQISWKDSGDIASWLLSIKGGWKVETVVPPVDDPSLVAGLDDLVRLYVSKGGFKDPKTKEVKTVALSEVESFVKQLSVDDKLHYLGEKTIARLGCFGCHNISGFEDYKPIGTALNGWGAKSPTKLDYAHITEYLVDQPAADDGSRDGTDPYYQEQLAEHTRAGFLYQKLHRPRSYDYKKTNEDVKSWDDRLRMPQFTFADDPKAIEEIMTFVLGLTGEKINSKYLPNYSYKPAQVAIAQGTKLLNRYNCTGCHVVEMPKFTIADSSSLESALVNFYTNVKVSYLDRAKDFGKELYPRLQHDPKATLDFDVASDDPDTRARARREFDAAVGLVPADGKPIVIEGMQTNSFENEISVQVWKPVTIRGYTFNVGDTLTIDKTAVQVTPAKGGDFAWLYAADQVEKSNADYASLWNRLPPPLVREGAKVQTPWLTSFLQAPYPIRPAANLRMPRFHLGKSDEFSAKEAEGIANYFAAVDGKDFPYQILTEKDQAYLAALEAKHPNYLGNGWQLMTKGACIQCHAIGPYKPTGGEQVVNGPDLRQVSNRFRPEYLLEWLARPSRLLPYTAMPQNIAPTGPPAPGVPKALEGQTYLQVQSMRDTLLNYVDAIEQQVASGAPSPAPAAPAAPAPAAAPGAVKAGGGQ